MARSVQIRNKFSVKLRPNFLIFLLSFLNKPNSKKKFGSKYTLTSFKQLISYELYMLLADGCAARLRASKTLWVTSLSCIWHSLKKSIDPSVCSHKIDFPTVVTNVFLFGPIITNRLSFSLMTSKLFSFRE
jgi:hypothetical protein